MVELAGAKLVPGTIDLHGDLPEPPVVPLRRERLEGLIGVAYADAEVDRVLGRLGYEWEGTGWRVPTWRAADTTREVDLIEEVARIVGLERVPVEMPGGAPGGGRLNAEERLRRTVVDVLRGAGLSEAATLTLWDTGVPDRLRLAAGRPPPRAGRAHEPDERRLGGDADAGLPGAAALGAPQPGHVGAAGGALRDRARVPARRGGAARPARARGRRSGR